MEGKLEKAIDLLINCELNSDQSADERTSKINAINIIGQHILNNQTLDEEYRNVLQICIVALFRILQDSDMNVWSLAEQVLIKITKSIHRRYHERIIAAIWRCFKGKDWIYKKKDRVVIKMIGRSRRFAIEMFSIYSDSVLSERQEDFMKSLINTLYNIVKLNDDQLLQESLATHIRPFILNHLSFSTIEQLSPLIKQLIENLTLPNSRVRRSAVTCLAYLCQDNINHYSLIELISKQIIELVKVKEKLEHQDLISFDDDIDDKSQFQINTSSPPTIQGVLYGFNQIVKIVGSRESYKVKNPLESFFPSILNIITQSLRLKNDNNVIVSALELLDEIFLNEWNKNISESIYNDKSLFEFLENTFDETLFQNSSNTSAKVLVVSCLCNLTRIMTPTIEQYIRSRFNNIVNIVLENDQILRGQTYYFIGCFLKRILVHPIDDWNNEEQVYELVTKLLACINEEKSSNVIKMACESINNFISSLLYSKYAWISLEIINTLIMVPDSSQTMIKSKIFSILSNINYNIVDELENDPTIRMKCYMTFKYDHTSFQNEVIKFISNHLDANDQHIRKGAIQALVNIIPNIKLKPYMKERNNTLQADKVYVREKGEYKNETYYLVWLLAPKVYDDDGQYMKSFNLFLRNLLDKGYDIPYQYAYLLFNNIQTNNFRNDIESYLDIIYVLSRFIRKHKYDLKTDVVSMIFEHVIKSMELLSQSITSNTTLDSKKLKDSSTSSDILLLDLKDRMVEAYSLSLTSYHRTLFDNIVVNIIQSLKYVIERCGYESFINVERILSHVRFEIFSNHSDIVINLLKTLAESCIKEGYKNILKNFERIFIACKNFCKLSTSLRIISRTYILISDLVHYGIQYRTVDGDLSFFDYVYNTYMMTDNMSSFIDQLNVYHLLYILTVISKKYINTESILSDSFYDKINKSFEIHWEYQYNIKAFKRICRLLFNPESKDDDFGGNTLKLKEVFINNLISKLPQNSSIEMLLTIISHIQDDEELCRITYKNVFSRLSHILNERLPESINIISLINFIEMIPPVYLNIHDLTKVLEYYLSINERIDINKASIIIKLIDKIQLNEQNTNEKSLRKYPIFLNLVYKIIYQIIEDINKIKDNENLFHSTLKVIELINQLLKNCNDQNLFGSLKSLFNDESKEFINFINLIQYDILQSSLIIEKLTSIFTTISYCEPIVIILTNLKNNNQWYTKQLRMKLVKNISKIIYYMTSIDDNLISHIFTDSILSSFVELIDDQNVSMSLKRILLSIPNLEKTILNFIRYYIEENNKMISNTDSFKILKLVTHLTPSIDVLNTIGQFFLSNSNQYFSSLLIAEDYVMKILENNSSLADSFIHKYSKTLRGPFHKRLSQKFKIDMLEERDNFQNICEKFHAALSSGDKREICTSINIINSNFCAQFDYNYDSISLKTRAEIESMYPDLENLYDTEKESMGSLILFEPEEITKQIIESNADFQSIELNWERIIEFVHLINLSFDQFGCSLFSLHNHRVQIHQLFSISIYSLKEIIQSHKLGKFHSLFDMLIIMKFIKNLFYYLEVQDKHIKTTNLMRDLIYNIYYFMLVIIRSSNVISINEQSFDHIDQVLQFIYNLLHENRVDQSEVGRYRILSASLHMLSALTQSSSSLELNSYPFQNDPINYDYNHDPICVLETFEYMLNTYPPRFPETFEKLWRQIIIGIDPKSNIPTIATSDKIKIHSFRALSSLILSVKEEDGSSINSLVDQNPNFLPFNVYDTRKLQENFVILHKSLHISSLIDEYLDLLSVYLEKYLNFTISSPQLGKECLRSVVLLSDLFVPNQRSNVYSIIVKGLENQQEIYKEDILMKMTLLLGLCKLFPVMYSIQRDQIDEEIKQKILKTVNHHILNQPTRKQLPQNDDKSILSIPNNIILLCISYLLQNKECFGSNNETISTYISRIENNEIDYFIPTDLTKKLAKLCSFLQRLN